MIWILLIASALLPNLFWSNLEKAKQTAKPIHEFCLSAFEPSKQRAVHQALVCGKNLSSHDPKERSLKNTSIAVGIYHVLVVSGAHLTFLEKILSKIKTPIWLVRLILLGFALMAHWDPPVVRALFESLLRSHTQKGWLSVFLSYIFSIALHPQWIHSGSLHLSIAARSALELPLAGAFKQAFVASLFLWPLIHSWSPMQFTLILLSVLTAELSLGIWLFSTVSFLIGSMIPLIADALGLNETLIKTWIHFLSGEISGLGARLVDLLHFGLNSLSRWQPHENQVWFHLPQTYFFAYAALLLLVTGLSKRVLLVIKLKNPDSPSSRKSASLLFAR